MTDYPPTAPPSFPPPPAPEPTPSRRWPLFVGIGLVVTALVVAAGAIGFAVSESSAPTTTTTTTTTEPEPETVSVDYEIEVVSDAYCEDFWDTGYDDIPFADVEVFDGKGNLLGFTQLGAGYDTATSCIFEARFDIEESSDGKYRVTAGNVNRGYVNFDESEVRNGTLRMDIILGD